MCIQQKIVDRKLLRALTLALLTALPNAAFGQDHNQDEVDIRKVETEQQNAWNHHDARAYANLFTEDGDVVNVVGWWWKGRAEIEKKLTDAYAFVFRESGACSLDHGGRQDPKGIPEPQQGIQIQVLQKQARKWLISSFQNTNSVPERPFPKGPPDTDSTPNVKP